MVKMAYAQQGAPHGSDPLSALLFQFVFFLFLMAIFYFLLIRPQQKARKRHQEFLAGLKKGERVVTSGGIIGTVVEIGEKTVTLRVDANTRVTFLKENIVGYYTEKEEKE
ncbi:preprotein translocase, YajC subunit [Thermocrinis albus DSM 14484]|uniref:Sec translocon accessory complex subunit YajC n=1 Tax=Thermocrinis albus (strain DSM 14484 / JCM 11386 / HI 11/12) TaxID=638303 RepID=D3SPB5_THEAH|nr:preprotein translocase subunit YajC [Thermocrinis albus]ADC89002.1 preprotein translocase, YajC subunit [Thermocrinis albus DSM 14484]